MEPIPVPLGAHRQMPWARKLDIGPPPNAAEVPTVENCGTLPALVEKVPGEPIRIRSYWQPSSEELERLNRGAPVELTAVTPVMVAVAINVPFDADAPRAVSSC